MTKYYLFTHNIYLLIYIKNQQISNLEILVPQFDKQQTEIKKVLKNFQPVSKLPNIESGLKSVLLTPEIWDKLGIFDVTGITPFKMEVYRQLSKIKAGSVITYSGLASLTGKPKASRAVGSAMAQNRFPFIIPCHRVVKTDGLIGNYSYSRLPKDKGCLIKQYLLNSEGIKTNNLKVKF